MRNSRGQQQGNATAVPGPQCSSSRRSMFNASSPLLIPDMSPSHKRSPPPFPPAPPLPRATPRTQVSSVVDSHSSHYHITITHTYNNT
jgi:hypothetical protein